MAQDIADLILLLIDKRGINNVCDTWKLTSVLDNFKIE